MQVANKLPSVAVLMGSFRRLAIVATLAVAGVSGCSLESDGGGLGQRSATITGHPTYNNLSETGLYDDIDARSIASGILEFTPAYPLWTDGAAKKRWISLPDGVQIDNTDQDRWVFPPGTKVWKQFARPEDGRLLETRLIEVNAAGDFEVAAFVWNDQQTDAQRDRDGAENVGGTMHDVPAEAACGSCHMDSGARVLGFSAVQLSHEESANLVSPEVEDLLTDPPGQTFPVPGDDVEAAAVGYLHGNCGHCHNAEYITSLKMRVRVTDLTVADTDVFQTGVGADSHFRPGDPENSLAWQRMNNRGSGSSPSQMPPLGTEFVDPQGLAAVEAWIDHLDSAQDVLVSGDSPCPSGYSLITPDEARESHFELCNMLGAWDIVRLGGGGSMDGRGYGCGIRDADTRSLGHAFCKAPNEFSVSSGDGVCTGDTNPVSPWVARAHTNDACSVLGTWYIARLSGGGSMGGRGYSCQIHDSDERGLGHTLCADYDFVRVQGDTPCPSGYRYISPDEARSRSSELCSLLGTWDIVRLAGGGSMDGPGYGCGIRDLDNRGLGHSLCTDAR